MNEIEARRNLWNLWTIQTALTDYRGSGGDTARTFEAGLVKRAFASDPKSLAIVLEATLRKGR